MRKGLRRLLFVSVLAFGASAATLVGFAISARTSGPSHVSDVEVCSLLTSNEVQQLLNTVAANGPGTPQPNSAGGACAWGTGRGESFELTVVPHQLGTVLHPCAGISGTEISVGGWVGCSRLEFGPGNVLTAFKGVYNVSIAPEVDVIGYQYESTEESTITHVFRELRA